MACEMEVEASCRNYLDYSELCDQEPSSLPFAQGIPHSSPCSVLARIQGNGSCSYRNSNDVFDNSLAFSRLQNKSKRKNFIEMDASACGNSAQKLIENVEPPSKRKYGDCYGAVQNNNSVTSNTGEEKMVANKQSSTSSGVGERCHRCAAGEAGHLGHIFSY